MSPDLEKIRNIGIAAHIDAGKTTTTERILYYTGATHAPGEVDLATTKTDFDPQEQERGITIYSAAVSFHWRDYTVNLIDTPGHVDFTAEVERCLRVLDGAVVVFDGKEGVEPQSETVWRQANRYKVPRICLINKMDKLGADFASAFESIEKRLSSNPVAVSLPIGAENRFEGIIDLVTMTALHYDTGTKGAQFETGEIPAELKDQATDWRRKLEEKAADFSDQVMEHILEDRPIPEEDLRKAIRTGTLANKLQPVLCGSALRFIGIQPVLDAVCDYLPSPADVPPIEVQSLKGGGKTEEIQIRPNPDAPLVAYLFKIVADKPVDLYFLRVYAGQLKPNSRIINAANNNKENITRIFRMFAKRRDQLMSASAGDIVAVVGPKSSLTGHTLCDPKRVVSLESIEFPETVINQSIEPKSSRDRDKLIEALEALSRQDPTFRSETDPDTGQTLMYGMGELHLEVLVRRLREDMRVDVHVGRPRAAYRETITKVAEAEFNFNRQLGGRQHVASVTLRLEPLPLGDVPGDTAFSNQADVEMIEQRFIPAIRDGVRDGAASGPRGGYPLVGWKAVLLNARQHDTDSSELAFESAARLAFSECLKGAAPVLLEPIMSVEIHTPDEYFGPVTADLNSRRAIITGTDVRGEYRVIDAEVPLPEVFGYVTHLRSISQGRASVSITPSHYGVVPGTIAERLVGSP